MYVICVCALLISPAFAECNSEKCNAFNKSIYPDSQGRVVVGSIAEESALSGCAISDREPLLLNKRHQLYREIKKSYPEKISKKDPIQVVLHENTPECEITLVTLK